MPRGLVRVAMRCPNRQGIPEPPAASIPAYRGGPDARRWGSSEPGHFGTPKSHIIYTPVPSLAWVQTLLSAYRA